MMFRHRPKLTLSRLGDIVRAVIPAYLPVVLARVIARDRTTSTATTTTRSQSRSDGDGAGTSRHGKKRAHAATAYLDGLRGLAALGVFGYHYTDYNHKYFHTGWGVEPAERGSSVLQLPYVRLLHAGRPMVHVFFVVSGFALSLRPLRELHAGRLEACRASLASASLRRPVRLLGPCLLLTLSLVFWCRAGFFHHYIAPRDTLTGQIADWAADFWGRVAWVWDWEHGERPRYNVHLWTIAVELSHSYALFFVLLLLSVLRPRVRPAVTLASMAYTLRCGRWAVFDFLAGCLLSDLHLWERNRRAEPGPDLLPRDVLGGGAEKPSSNTWTAGSQVLSASVLLVTGYVMSWPGYEPFPATYDRLLEMVPYPFSEHRGWEQKADFWFALCALATVWAAGRATWLRGRVLESRFAQHAGRVSFAFYILQHPELNLLQPIVMGEAPHAARGDAPASRGWGLRGWPGVETWTQRVASWAIGWVVIGGVLFLAADVYTRLVDRQCIRLSRWVEERLCVLGGDPAGHVEKGRVGKEMSGVGVG